jgi:hypothetical protein
MANPFGDYMVVDGASAGSSAAGSSSTKRPRTEDGGDDAEAIKCKCQLAAKRFVVRKEGPNKGKAFFKCPSEKCDLFVCPEGWASGGGGGGAYGGGGGASAGAPGGKQPAAGCSVTFFGSGAAAAAAPAARVSYSLKTLPTAECLPALTPEEAAVMREFQLEVTQEDAARIRDTPQRSEAWKKARNGRITASMAGTFVGFNKHQSADKGLQEMLWKTFTGNAACSWGTFFERRALYEYGVVRMREFSELYMETLRNGHTLPHGITEMPFQVRESGLIVNPSIPWLGVSPDGLVDTIDPETGEKVTGLLEIKAPWSGTIYADQAQYADSKFPGVPAGVPPPYYVQIQTVMAVAGLPWADLCVWTLDKMSISRYEFNQSFWLNTLLPKLRKFYFERLAPAMRLKAAGKLREGQTEEVLRV